MDGDRTSLGGALAVLTISTALALSGCGAAERSADNHGYGWGYDEVGASGLRLRYDPAVTEASRYPLAVFEGAFATVVACLERDAPGPLVVVVPFGSLDGNPGFAPPPGAHVGGLYYFDTDLVVVTESLYALPHELVHYLLDQARFPVDRNRSHQDPGFDRCGQYESW